MVEVQLAPVLVIVRLDGQNSEVRAHLISGWTKGWFEGRCGGRSRPPPSGRRCPLGEGASVLPRLDWSLSMLCITGARRRALHQDPVQIWPFVLPSPLGTTRSLDALEFAKFLQLAMAELLARIWDADFGGWDRVLDRGHAIACFERHNAEVRASCPPSRLLEWTVADGWGPLCRALGVAEPVEPFPHLNAR
jgi:hypothetical protein